MTPVRLSVAEITSTWADAEFWPAPGLGCAHCHEGVPVVDVDFGRLCPQCLLGWFPGRTWDWMMDWLVRQREALRWREKERMRQWTIQLLLWPGVTANV